MNPACLSPPGSIWTKHVFVDRRGQTGAVSKRHPTSFVGFVGFVEFAIRPFQSISCLASG